ncbi:hypothetical protein HY604_03535 [Candidatus Peregrinibacteria bacterium]|nr:hypothetical protein [Candidatus Peregrinibacteria bacterium]
MENTQDPQANTQAAPTNAAPPAPTPAQSQPASQTAAPQSPQTAIETQPTPEAQPAQSAQQPAEPQPTPQAAAAAPVDVKKTYYKTFSPRLLGIAFSYAIDKDRAKMTAKNKGCTVPENPLVLENGNMFWGELMIEVQNANAQDSNVVDLTQKEVAVGTSLSELEKAAGKTAVKTYTLHQGAETKTVAIFS